jgi:hypothetical protein
MPYAGGCCLLYAASLRLRWWCGDVLGVQLMMMLTASLGADGAPLSAGTTITAPIDQLVSRVGQKLSAAGIL